MFSGFVSLLATRSSCAFSSSFCAVQPLCDSQWRPHCTGLLVGYLKTLSHLSVHNLFILPTPFLRTYKRQAITYSECKSPLLLYLTYACVMVVINITCFNFGVTDRDSGVSRPFPSGLLLLRIVKGKVFNLKLKALTGGVGSSQAAFTGFRQTSMLLGVFSVTETIR